MNQEAQRIAIAEACGWSDAQKHDGFISGYKPGTDCKSDWRRWHLPDYLNDLNAMHEAEKVLIKGGMWVDYTNWIGMGSIFPNRLIVHATAKQRAEAFLKTLGKWEDEA